MRDRFFLDSNVLIYGFSASEPDKQAVARKLAADDGVWVSTQVLGEVGNVLIRKFGFSVGEARTRIASIIAACDVVAVTTELVLEAFRIAERYRLALYDAQIVAAALSCGARRLFTEDLHHGLTMDGIEILSPFASAAREPTARYRARGRPRRSK